MLNVMCVFVCIFVSAKVRLKEKPVVTEGKLQESELDIVQQLEGEIRVAVETLHLERDNEAKYVNHCCNYVKYVRQGKLILIRN
jgi:hypothetical protein